MKSKIEMRRQKEIAKKYALPIERWNKEDLGYVGAYHLGRLEALQDILEED